MQLAILHFHLDPGGVTRVIANQLLALDAAVEESLNVLVLYDGRHRGWPAADVAELEHVQLQRCPVSGLAYDSAPQDRTDELADELQNVLSSHGFTADDTLIHAHNHSLGKNASVPGTLAELARRGFRLLLQIHDFAEDFRPANYRHLRESLSAERLRQELYPLSKNIAYAVLNRRDESILEAAGLPASRIHFLPNPVIGPGPLPKKSAAREVIDSRLSLPKNDPYFVYPVRGIRRKNVGELVLLAAAADAGQFAITLAPANPAQRPWYERWNEFSTEHGLPCRFSVGDAGISFPENLAAADCLLTTSVAEGFGMVFLECWTADRMLGGRNLPEITADFAAAGLDLSMLYDRLDIPIEWIGADRYINALHSGYARLCRAYGRSEPFRIAAAESLERRTINGHIDFADLDEPLQEVVIRRVSTDPTAREHLLEINPRLPCPAPHPSLITANCSVVEQEYGLLPSGKGLLDVYETSWRGDSVDGGAAVEPEAILDAFLQIDRYRLIRS